MPAGEAPSCILRYPGVLDEDIPAEVFLTYEKTDRPLGKVGFCTMIT